MFKQVAKQCAAQATRKFSSTRPNNFQVTVCGASGGIGQPLSLLLKLNPLITRLNLYDIVRTVGVAADLSHIDTQSEVVGYEGQEKCGDSLKCSDVVLIAAGVPRKPGMTRDDLFDINASIVKELSQDIAKHNPNAMIGVLTNPVNSMVPIAAEVLKKAKVFNPKRLFGITTLDLVRSRKFIGDTLGINPKNVKIDVICGHSGVTIIPIFSNCEPKYEKNIEKTIKRIQTAGDEVLKAKAGDGTATLSMAYSAAIFTSSLLKALDGQPNVVECAFVHSDVCGTEYFALPILLGKNGIEKECGIPELNDFENKILSDVIPALKNNIARGVKFGTN